MSKLEILASPAMTAKMIRSSGFQISSVGNGGIIGIPLKGGQYQIIGRFSVPEEAVEGAARNGEVAASDGTCITYAPNQAGFEPTKTCSYKVTLTDEQIKDLAYGKARVNKFFPAINEGDAIPAVGGREITDPIEVSTFNLDPKVNRALHIATAKVWLACWNADASSDVNFGFDLPKTKGLDELAKCRKAKLGASSLEGDIKVAVSEAVREVSKEELRLATAENAKSSRLRQILSRWNKS